MANDGLRQRPVKEGSVVSPIAATETQAPKRVEPSAEARRADLAADTHHAYEFGGPIGVTAMMLGFPCLMYYLWICLWFYQGTFVRPSSVDDIRPFLEKMGAHIYQDAFPTKFAWAMYGGLMAQQLALAFIMPGKVQHGLPVASLDYITLPYFCNALSCFYTTLIISAGLHITGLFPLTHVIDNFGPLMSVSMICGFVLSTIVYFGCIFFHWGGKPLRMSGNFFYDFFMGAPLNPRLGKVDLKMWQEVRIPWVLLFHIAISAAIKQYETLGHVTANMAFMVLGTGLYINACAKGEECIPQTIDMIFEKDGFMLTFWNFAGVPFTYSYSIIYLHRTDPSVYQMSWPAIIGVYGLLAGSYYIFDTAMSQKSIFRMEQQGLYVPRASFPQLPWRKLENPKYIETKHGNKLLISGWWSFLMKPNYSADWVQSFTWGLCTGASTPIAYFYPVWFFTVLTHRCGRDFEKCARKYGDDWKRYTDIVKWKFIPGVY